MSMWLDNCYFWHLQVDCLVCSHCFRFIGSVELQIGRKLILQDLGLTDDNEKVCTMASHDVGTDSLLNRKDDTGTSTYQNLKENYISGEVLESLVRGNLSLPFSNIFSLPSVFDCPGGCKEEHYCRLEIKLCFFHVTEKF